MRRKATIQTINQSISSSFFSDSHTVLARRATPKYYTSVDAVWTINVYLNCGVSSKWLLMRENSQHPKFWCGNSRLLYSLDNSVITQHQFDRPEGNLSQIAHFGKIHNTLQVNKISGWHRFRGKIYKKIHTGKTQSN
jgi:hypothetical protein